MQSFLCFCCIFDSKITVSNIMPFKIFYVIMPFERYEGIREMLCVIRRPILLSYYIVHTWSLIRNKAIILLLGSMWLKSQIKNKYKAQELYTNNNCLHGKYCCDYDQSRKPAKILYFLLFSEKIIFAYNNIIFDRVA